MREVFRIFAKGDIVEKGTKSRGIGGGSKLNRSETVTIRLDPKLRYLTELAARKQRRTVSSFIEWAIERALDSVVLRESGDYRDNGGELLGGCAQELWDTDEADRLVKLALKYPELLNHEEQILWKLIKDFGLLWKGSYDNDGYFKWELKEETCLFPRLRKHWDTFKQVASGEADKSSLPQWSAYKPAPTPTPMQAPVSSPPAAQVPPLPTVHELLTIGFRQAPL